MKRVLEVVDDLIKQDKEARIVVGGDCNGMLDPLSRQLALKGFMPVIQQGVATHKLGNQLDQVWIRNLNIRSAQLADLEEQVSDHRMVRVVVEATVKVGKNTNT
jgi:endonuclease/exonuclease/phosphatase (EEP) superfamily protein YafD